MKPLPLLALCLAFCISAALADPADSTAPLQSLTVTATAYNATAAQTDGKPHVGAWGDRLDALEPGLRAVAVSPDLVAKGLKRNQRIRLDGLEGEFVVLDRTAGKHQKRVDIFMGKDVAGAKRFGKKTLKIHWVPASR